MPILKNIFNLVTFNSTITIIYLTCLFYQTYLIIDQYLQYNTVINIKFMKNVINSLPAITVCYNRIYSFEKLVQRYPENQGDYDNYTMFLNEYQFPINIDDNMSKLVLDGNEYYRQTYEYIIHEGYFEWLPAKFEKHSYQDIFENCFMQ